MARLNWAAVRHRGTTDVLSFPALELLGPAKADALADGRRALPAAGAALRKAALQSAPLPLVLGDTVICLPQALRQAKEQGHAPAMELRRLLVHSIAHLCGFDHERGPRGERAMNAFEDALLARLRAS